MTEPAGAWQPMESAPLAWVHVSEPLPELGVHRASEPVMLRGQLTSGAVIEFRAWWTSFGDDAPYWWDLDAEEPVDWPLLGWRHMTDEDRAKESSDAA